MDSSGVDTFSPIPRSTLSANNALAAKSADQLYDLDLYQTITIAGLRCYASMAIMGMGAAARRVVLYSVASYGDCDVTLYTSL